MWAVVRVALVAAIGLIANPARAQQGTPIARLLYQPPAGLSAHTWEPAARIGLAGTVITEDAAAVTSGLLSASVLMRYEHRIDLERFDPHGWPVFEIAVTADADGQERLLRNLRAVLLALGPGGAQEVADDSVVFASPAWPDGFDISWQSRPDALRIAIGGPLDADGSPPAVDLASHLGAVDEEVGQQRLLIVVDADRLRSFTVGDDAPAAVARDLLAGWGLGNARSVAYRVARYGNSEQLGAWLTWSPRSSRPGDVRGIELTERTWPEGELGPRPEDGGETIVLRQDLGTWLTLGLRAAIALQSPGTDRQGQLEAVNRWGIAAGPSLQQILESLGPVVGIADNPGPPLDLPGLGTALVPIRAESTADIGTDLADVLRAAGLTIAAEGADEGRSWRAGLLPERWDPRGVLSLLRWTVADGPAGRVLVIGWNEASLAKGRVWLAAEPSPDQGDGADQGDG